VTSEGEVKDTTFNRENLTLLKSKCGWFKSIATLVSVTPRGGWIDSSPARVHCEGLASQSLSEPVAHLEVNDIYKCITINASREIIHINKWFHDSLWQGMHDEVGPVDVLNAFYKLHGVFYRRDQREIRH
jgi:hypothetical protein